jgi:hypothetical protein
LKEGVFVEVCDECEQGKLWNGKSLALQLDHIDGDSSNVLENLRLLCPNCHSQTDTFAGRGKALKKRKSRFVSDAALVSALESSQSIREALLLVGLVASGANYIRAQKLEAQMVKHR